MKTPDQWLSDMLARSDDFAPGEIDKARAFVEAIQRDAVEECLRRVLCTPTCENYGRASGGMAMDFAAKDIRALLPKAKP